MPHVIVKMWPGKSEGQKARLAEQVAKAVVETLGSREESISVAIEEVGSEEWAEAVYKPDIQAKWDTLWTKPGYAMREVTKAQNKEGAK